MVIALALLVAVRGQFTVIPDKVPPAMPDVIEKLQPDAVSLNGYLGARVDANESQRLKNVDLKPLLEGFHKQPGSHPWIGEHIGKWIHASTLAFMNSRDATLKHKVDEAVAELIGCQQADGYLGTYIRAQRFGLYEGADWDVWTHKYDLIGLLAYYKATGNQASLNCCKKIGDLLIDTFGPGKKSILSAGTHMGMASTSVLEPMVLLYRQTGERRYLDFAIHIVHSWKEKDGPRIIDTLGEKKPIDKVANGKAYEMLSNLVGLCELARATGDRHYLDTAKLAWDDVVAHELYITGSASYYEHFHAGTDLPNQMSKNVGETCVTVTWIQLSDELFRLTGATKYADQIERSFYNHLAAAQNPDGKSWCYYTSLEGKKPYTSDTCCCLSSGPRGMAMAPSLGYLATRRDGQAYIVVNTLETSRSAVLIGGKSVVIRQQSRFPRQGISRLTITAPKAMSFGIMIRIPSWAGSMTSSVKGKVIDGWLVIPPKNYLSGETIDLHFELTSKIVMGNEGNKGKAAIMFGPFVMASQGEDSQRILTNALTNRPLSATSIPLVFDAFITGEYVNRQIRLVPFSEAGKNGEPYRIWMNAPGTKPPTEDELHLGTEEGRSDNGNADGSINDGDPHTFVVTFNGKPQFEAWFSLTFKQPKLVKRVEFVHGRTFHDGGWFDTSIHKPVIEAQLVRGGPWIKIGELASYRSTSSKESAGLVGGELFASDLESAVRLVAIRLKGTPSSGDNPNQSFASCGWRPK